MITIVEYDKEQKQLNVHSDVNWREFQLKTNHLYWWDLGQPDVDAEAILSEHFHFHPLAIEDCLADIHYPKVDYYETYLYMVMHGVDVDRSEVEGFAPKEVDVFLGKDYLVTYHRKDARSVAEVLRL